MSDPIFGAPLTNSFGLSDAGTCAAPTLVDIDGDGDLDAFVGTSSGNTFFFVNTSSATVPGFSPATVNPFGLVDVGSFASPTFADLDADGDLDIFVGDSLGNTQFFLNTGSGTTPGFTAAFVNPFGLADVGVSAAPTFVDIDGDADLDAFVGTSSGNTFFFLNTGGATAPGFSAPVTPPFGLSSVGFYSAPAFADLDADGDLDAFVGERSGNTLFFLNTGSATAPGFSAPVTNPFGLADVGASADPTFADIDGDGDLDAFVGNLLGNTSFFINHSISFWSLVGNAQVIPFDAQGSLLHFDDSSIAAAAVVVTSGSGSTDFTYGGKTVTLQTELKSLTTTNITFGDGSLLLVGDNNTGTINDDATNTLTGGSGNDQLQGLGGDDMLDGGAGNDLLYGGTGTDTLIGASGNDTYSVDSSSDLVLESGTASNESDLVRADASYTLGSNVENLELGGSSSINGFGNTADNVLTGNGGANLLDGAAGADSLLGGEGDDTYVIDDAADVISDTGGFNTVRSSVDFTLGDNLSNLTLTGSTAIDAVGNSLDNVLTGNGAGNRLDGNSGIDTLVGGLGDDTYVLNSTETVIREYSTNSTEIDLVTTSISYTLGANLNNLTMSTSVAIDAAGNSLDNILNGNISANLLDGRSGNDSLVGGSGDDTYVVDSLGDVVSETSTAANEIDLVRSTVSFTLSENLENLKFVDSVSIQAVGNGSNNVLNANAANNLLDGLAGTDTLIGGNGDDTYVVDDSADVVTEFPGAGTDLVRSSVGFTLGQNLENLKLLDTSSVQAVGNALNNVLNANLAHNVINGMAGADTMIGGNGDDTYVVDNQGDVVTEYTNAGIDSILSSVTYTLGANVNHLILTGSAAINGGGNGGANQLTGNRANNVLSGDYGADSLAGCSGGINDVGVGSIDTLTGGFDADHFILGNASRAFYNDGVAGAGSADYAILTDFQPSQGDTLGLKGSASLYTLGAYSNNSQNLYLDNGPTVGSFDSGDELIAKITTGTPVNLQQAIYQ